MEKRLFPTSVVGSLPRPKWLLDSLIAHESGLLSDQELKRTLDRAVPFAVALQEKAGLDIITDGEWRRIGYFEVLAQKLQGFSRGDFDKLEAKKRSKVRRLSRWTQKEFKQALVTQKIRLEGSLVAEEAKFLKQSTDKLIKVTLPSPYLVVNRLWHPQFSKKTYPTRENFLEDLVPIYQKEIKKLAQLNVHIVQFDDPWLCFFVDKNHRQLFKETEKEINFAVNSLNRVLAGIKGIKTGLHLCRGNRKRQRYASGGYEPIIDHLYRIKVDQLALEFSIEAAGGFEVFKDHPTGKEIGLGVVDIRSRKIQDAKEIIKKVEKALKFLKPEQITLNPDCGFAPTATNPIPLDEPYLKLREMVEAARILRRHYG